MPRPCEHEEALNRGNALGCVQVINRWLVTNHDVAGSEADNPHHLWRWPISSSRYPHAGHTNSPFIFFPISPQQLHSLLISFPNTSTISTDCHNHRDYQKEVGAAVGLHTMLTTDEGHCYGKDLGRYQIEYADWTREQTGSYNRNRNENPGRKKYNAKKRRMEERLHSYINQELNRFLKEEKPQIISVKGTKTRFRFSLIVM